MEGTQLLDRSWQLRNMAKSINSLLSHIQVIFLTHANLTVAALRLLPSSAIVFLLRKTDIYFYEVACYSEHLPREMGDDTFLLASSEAMDSAFLTL